MGITEFIWNALKLAIPVIISLILFYFSNGKAKKANELAEKAIEKSGTANDISLEAIKRADTANDIAQKKFALLEDERKERYKEGRPRVELKSMLFDTDEVDVYGGSNVLGVKPIDGKDYETGEYLGYDYTDIIKSPDRLKHSTRLSHAGKNYMFINLLSPKDVKNNLNNVILAFGVLSLVIDLGGNTVKELKIEKAYSMKSEKEHFADGLKINVKFPKPGAELKIPIAYACKNNTDMSVHLTNINHFKTKSEKSGKRTQVDFLEFRNDAEKFISFVETAYVFKCTTYCGKKYDYTIYLEIVDGKLCEPIEEDGTEFFDKKIAGREHIVQYSIDYQSDEEEGVDD